MPNPGFLNYSNLPNSSPSSFLPSFIFSSLLHFSPSLLHLPPDSSAFSTTSTFLLIMTFATLLFLFSFPLSILPGPSFYVSSSSLTLIPLYFPIIPIFFPVSLSPSFSAPLPTLFLFPLTPWHSALPSSLFCPPPRHGYMIFFTRRGQLRGMDGFISDLIA